MENEILKKKYVVALFSILLASSGCSPAPSPRDVEHTKSPGLISREGSDRLIVFVHGFLGDGVGTWTHRFGAYWPQLLAEDPAFDGTDFFVLDYESSALGESLSVDELSDNLRLKLEGIEAPRRYKDVVFLAHSMGGVVTRAFLLKHGDLVSVPMVYFFGVPTNGADLGDLASLLGDSPQARGLRTIRDNLYLQGQTSSWLASKLPKAVRSYCAYETRDTGGVRVVPRDSATALCNERLDPIAEDHIRLVKPAGKNSDSYIAFKVAFLEVFENQKLVSEASDLIVDGTSEIAWTQNTLVADQLTVKGRRLVVPEGALIVANTVSLTDGAALSGLDFAVAAGALNGGRIDVSGTNGEVGGTLVLAVGRLSGTTIDASGGDGANGQAGQDGSPGLNGAEGVDGKCGPGVLGQFRGSTGGGNGTDGSDGTDGSPGGDGGDGGKVYLATLNQPSLQPDVSGGEPGRGGAGGRGGQGGQGGAGGSGCSGLGGSQPTRPDGRNGKDGRDGRTGPDGRQGDRGNVWSKRISNLEEISNLIPEADAIPDYREGIVERLKSLATDE